MLGLGLMIGGGGCYDSCPTFTSIISLWLFVCEVKVVTVPVVLWLETNVFMVSSQVLLLPHCYYSCIIAGSSNSA